MAMWDARASAPLCGPTAVPHTLRCSAQGGARAPKCGGVGGSVNAAGGAQRTQKGDGVWGCGGRAHTRALHIPAPVLNIAADGWRVAGRCGRVAGGWWRCVVVVGGGGGGGRCQLSPLSRHQRLVPLLCTSAQRPTPSCCSSAQRVVRSFCCSGQRPAPFVPMARRHPGGGPSPARGPEGALHLHRTTTLTLRPWPATRGPDLSAMPGATTCMRPGVHTCCMRPHVHTAHAVCAHTSTPHMRQAWECAAWAPVLTLACVLTSTPQEREERKQAQQAAAVGGSAPGGVEDGGGVEQEETNEQRARRIASQWTTDTGEAADDGDGEGEGEEYGEEHAAAHGAEVDEAKENVRGVLAG
eukprot:361454-Chlamydomonas_euryale.AAC.2